jgi:hypothetical protein
MQLPRVGCTSIAHSINAVKINVDATVSKHGNKGVIAEICRDEHRAFLGASVLAVQGLLILQHWMR